MTDFVRPGEGPLIAPRKRGDWIGACDDVLAVIAIPAILMILLVVFAVAWRV